MPKLPKMPKMPKIKVSYLILKYTGYEVPPRQDFFGKNHD